LNGVDAEVYAVHAGLECGFFQGFFSFFYFGFFMFYIIFVGSYPGLKCISVGPYLKDVHSPDETLYLDTVNGIYKLIVSVLEKLDK
jgi:dipeptidase D